MLANTNIRIESLITLCEIISLSGDKEKIKQKILSDSIDWLCVIEIANRYFLTAALYYSLLDQDMLKFINDEELLAYLEQIYTINLHRNQSIIEQSKEITQILLKKGIKPVFLKGTASLLQKDYKDEGMRFLSDIDFCVFEKDFLQTKKQLLSFGYIPNMNDPGIKDIEKHHHWWPMYHPNWEVSIETHRSILTYPYSHLIECKDDNCQNATYYPNMTILSPTFRLIHTYIHSDIVDRSYAFKTMDLRQLYEMSRVIDKYRSEIDWRYIEEFFKTHNILSRFNNRLYLIKILFKVHSPILIENRKCKLHLSVLFIFFKYPHTFIINKYRNFQLLRFKLSYRKIRQRYGVSTKTEYIYYASKILRNHIFAKLR
ncbi:hypothetical protein TSL6_05380 [Sulfurovum sp. TSL6]|uniref:nucleotidyltransferase family protein n=1 Tax=Sulfurovum sp. TSL6 TaxID=2826995 RepID=UPI001CC82B0E|nr:nucleotidyltransferase family protein [Sulfurovum sp. TSL6]GIU00032.1 hypothetical protein TSL6_05380 [Sulfurovum sp. TSL6]